MREVVSRRLLALVLFVVLVWHTEVIPSYAPAPARRRHRRPPEPGVRKRRAGEGDKARARASAASLARAEPAAATPDSSLTADDLDWPEYIDVEDTR